MSNPNDSEYSDNDSRPVIAFTSGQLVMVFVMFLILAAVLFGVAIKIGRMESVKTADSQSNSTTASSESTTSTGPIASNPASPSPGSGQGIQLSPVPAIMPSAKPASASSPSNAGSSADAYKEFAAPPPPGEGAANAAATPAANTPKPAPQETPKTAETVSTASSAPVVDLEPLSIPSDASAAPEKTTSAESTPEASAPPVKEAQATPSPTSPSEPPLKETASAPAASGKSGGTPLLTVQIAAVPAAKRSEAEDFMRRHKDIAPELLESPDGKWLRVVVGSFDNRDAANAKRDELKKRDPDFSACWVRARE